MKKGLFLVSLASLASLLLCACNSGGNSESSSEAPIAYDAPVVGTRVAFGKYPQTEVTDEALLEKLATAADIDDDGYIEYGGREFEAIMGISPLSARYKYERDKYYYFEVEELSWLSYPDGTMICEKIIDANQYSVGRMFPSLYEDSNLKYFLNVDFYDKAFSDEEKESILTTTVDNSASTTFDNGNEYVYDEYSTDDKVFPLSYKEALSNEYGFSKSVAPSSTRAKYVTDYAFLKFGDNEPTSGKACYWTRSPSSFDKKVVSCIDENGELLGSPEDIPLEDNYGVVPVIKYTPNAGSTDFEHTLTIDTNLGSNNGFGTITGAGRYTQGTKVTLTVTVNFGYKFLGWYLRNTLLSTSATLEYEMPDEDVAITANFSKWEIGSIVEFGRYPQECINDPNDPSASPLPEGIDEATDNDDDGYIEFAGNDYYKLEGSGVNNYEAGTNYYFQVSPLKWEVLSDGTIISKDIIDVHTFNESLYGGGNNYASDFFESDIEEFLNVSTYFTPSVSGRAFTQDEWNLLPVNEIDPSVGAELVNGWNPSYYYYNYDTVSFHGLYLITYDEANSAGQTARIKKATDYAMFKDVYGFDSSTKQAAWWLRSPSPYTDIAAAYVDAEGKLDNLRVNNNLGVVPAFKIASLAS